MNDRLAFLVVLLFPCFLWAQPKASIDVMGSLDIGYRRLSEKVADFGGIEVRNETEIPGVNWRAGLHYNRSLKAQAHLRLGLNVASLGYKTRSQNILWPSENDGMGGFIDDPTLPNTIQTISNFLFLSIPVALRFEGKSSTFNPYVEVGIAPSFYLQTRTVQLLDEERASFVRFDELTSPTQLAYIASIGANYQLAEKFQLFSQLEGRYHTQLFRDNPFVRENLYGVGLSIGIRRLIF